MNICIYGASSQKISPAYLEEAMRLGEALGNARHRLVFGGGLTGMMGAVAEGFQKAGAEIVGVAPTFFCIPGVLLENCNDFIYTETMRERKQVMEDLSDAFVALPGGIGTLDELFEIMTLRQLGRHEKPVFLYNCDGFFDGLLDYLNTLAQEQFMAPLSEQELFRVVRTPEELLEHLKN